MRQLVAVAITVTLSFTVHSSTQAQWLPPYRVPYSRPVYYEKRPTHGLQMPAILGYEDLDLLAAIDAEMLRAENTGGRLFGDSFVITTFPSYFLNYGPRRYPYSTHPAGRAGLLIQITRKPPDSGPSTAEVTRIKGDLENLQKEVQKIKGDLEGLQKEVNAIKEGMKKR